MMNTHDLCSALVILKSRSAQRDSYRSIAGRSDKPPDMTDRVQGLLCRLGFEAGTMAGVGFTIFGTTTAFHDAFGVDVKRMRTGGFGFQVPGSSNGCTRSLPIDHVPMELRREIEMIAFSPVPEFEQDWPETN